MLPLFDARLGLSCWEISLFVSLMVRASVCRPLPGPASGGAQSNSAVQFIQSARTAACAAAVAGERLRGHRRPGPAGPRWQGAGPGAAMHDEC